MHVTNDQFSEKVNNNWRKIKMTDLLLFSLFTSIIWPRGRDNFKFNNGGELLSSALLFQVLAPKNNGMKEKVIGLTTLYEPKSKGVATD